MYLSNKYLYYKKKYLEYKMKHVEHDGHSGNLLFPLTPLGQIKKMFIECKLAQLIDTRIRQSLKMNIVPQSVIEQHVELRRSGRAKKTIAESNYALASPRIVYNPQTPLLFTPKTLVAIEPDLRKDDEAIEKLVFAEEEDPEYIEYDKEYGKIIETWFADNIQCPCCGLYTLRRYSSNIFPIIDLVCVNLDHGIDKVRYFQVKTSNGRLYRGDKYFNIGTPTVQGHIYTGSRRAGEPIHAISASSSPHDKSFAIGYICISIYEFEPSDPTFIINSIDIVLPDLSKLTEDYYFYVNNTDKPKISWNIPNMLITSTKVTIGVPRDYFSTHDYESVKNPLENIRLESTDFEEL